MGDASPDDPVVVLDVDGAAVPAATGQSLLSAMIAAGRWITRRHPVTGEPRGAYCGMGICFECEVEVDGRPDVRACAIVVDRRMRVRTHTTGAP